jgi:heme/copper-type cytochrome/quinol oxidase subunit 2
VCPDITTSTLQQSRSKETPKNLWTKYDKDESKKLVGEEAVKVKQSESKYLTIGIVATVVFIVLVIVIVIATYRSKKNVQAPVEQKTESDTNKKIESI